MLMASLRRLYHLGGGGVHVFILVSGFGLCLSNLNKPLTYTQFLRRRFSRIYLPFVFIVLLSSLWTLYLYGTFDYNAFFSNVFLYKMFSPKYNETFGIQMWFISTIVQFYICWPLLLQLLKFQKRGVAVALFISMFWWLLTTLLGKNDERVWNGFFLQYLWEFVLGMYLALIYYNNPEKFIFPRLRYLFIYACIGLGLTGLLAWDNSWLRSFNDIPSLIGYLSSAMIIYSISGRYIKIVLCKINNVSYEWYLTHMLIFSIVAYINWTNIPMLLLISFISSLGFAIIYKYILSFRLKF